MVFVLVLRAKLAFRGSALDVSSQQVEGEHR